jgi:hypothetical protein
MVVLSNPCLTQRACCCFWSLSENKAAEAVVLYDLASLVGSNLNDRDAIAGLIPIHMKWFETLH